MDLTPLPSARTKASETSALSGIGISEIDELFKDMSNEADTIIETNMSFVRPTENAKDDDEDKKKKEEGESKGGEGNKTKTEQPPVSARTEKTDHTTLTDESNDSESGNKLNKMLRFASMLSIDGEDKKKRKKQQQEQQKKPPQLKRKYTATGISLKTIDSMPTISGATAGENAKMDKNREQRRNVESRNLDESAFSLGSSFSLGALLDDVLEEEKADVAEEKTNGETKATGPGHHTDKNTANTEEGKGVNTTSHGSQKDDSLVARRTDDKSDKAGSTTTGALLKQDGDESNDNGDGGDDGDADASTEGLTANELLLRGLRKKHSKQRPKKSNSNENNDNVKNKMDEGKGDNDNNDDDDDDGDDDSKERPEQHTGEVKQQQQQQQQQQPDVTPDAEKIVSGSDNNDENKSSANNDDAKAAADRKSKALNGEDGEPVRTQAEVTAADADAAAAATAANGDDDSNEKGLGKKKKETKKSSISETDRILLADLGSQLLILCERRVVSFGETLNGCWLTDFTPINTAGSRGLDLPLDMSPTLTGKDKAKDEAVDATGLTEKGEGKGKGGRGEGEPATTTAADEGKKQNQEEPQKIAKGSNSKSPAGKDKIEKGGPNSASANETNVGANDKIDNKLKLPNSRKLAAATGPKMPDSGRSHSSTQTGRSEGAQSVSLRSLIDFDLDEEMKRRDDIDAEDSGHQNGEGDAAAPAAAAASATTTGLFFRDPNEGADDSDEKGNTKKNGLLIKLTSPSMHEAILSHDGDDNDERKNSAGADLAEGQVGSRSKPGGREATTTQNGHSDAGGTPNGPGYYYNNEQHIPARSHLQQRYPPHHPASSIYAQQQQQQQHQHHSQNLGDGGADRGYRSYHTGQIQRYKRTHPSPSPHHYQQQHPFGQHVAQGGGHRPAHYHADDDDDDDDDDLVALFHPGFAKRRGDHHRRHGRHHPQRGVESVQPGQSGGRGRPSTETISTTEADSAYATRLSRGGARERKRASRARYPPHGTQNSSQRDNSSGRGRGGRLRSNSRDEEGDHARLSMSSSSSTDSEDLLMALNSLPATTYPAAAASAAARNRLTTGFESSRTAEGTRSSRLHKQPTAAVIAPDQSMLRRGRRNFFGERKRDDDASETHLDGSSLCRYNVGIVEADRSGPRHRCAQVTCPLPTQHTSYEKEAAIFHRSGPPKDIRLHHVYGMSSLYHHGPAQKAWYCGPRRDGTPGGFVFASAALGVVQHEYRPLRIRSHETTTDPIQRFFRGHKSERIECMALNRSRTVAATASRTPSSSPSSSSFTVFVWHLHGGMQRVCSFQLGFDNVSALAFSTDDKENALFVAGSRCNRPTLSGWYWREHKHMMDIRLPIISSYSQTQGGGGEGDGGFTAPGIVGMSVESIIAGGDRRTAMFHVLVWGRCHLSVSLVGENIASSQALSVESLPPLPQPAAGGGGRSSGSKQDKKAAAAPSRPRGAHPSNYGGGQKEKLSQHLIEAALLLPPLPPPDRSSAASSTQLLISTDCGALYRIGASDLNAIVVSGARRRLPASFSWASVPRNDVVCAMCAASSGPKGGRAQHDSIFAATRGWMLLVYSAMSSAPLQPHFTVSFREYRCRPEIFRCSPALEFGSDEEIVDTLLEGGGHRAPDESVLRQRGSGVGRVRRGRGGVVGVDACCGRALVSMSNNQIYEVDLARREASVVLYGACERPTDLAGTTSLNRVAKWMPEGEGGGGGGGPSSIFALSAQVFPTRRRRRHSNDARAANGGDEDDGDGGGDDDDEATSRGGRAYGLVYLWNLKKKFQLPVILVMDAPVSAVALGGCGPSSRKWGGGREVGRDRPVGRPPSLIHRSSLLSHAASTSEETLRVAIGTRSGKIVVVQYPSVVVETSINLSAYSSSSSSSFRGSHQDDTKWVGRKRTSAPAASSSSPSSASSSAPPPCAISLLEHISLHTLAAATRCGELFLYNLKQKSVSPVILKKTSSPPSSSPQAAAPAAGNSGRGHSTKAPAPLRDSSQVLSVELDASSSLLSTCHSNGTMRFFRIRTLPSQELSMTSPEVRNAVWIPRSGPFGYCIRGVLLSGEDSSNPLAQQTLTSSSSLRMHQRRRQGGDGKEEEEEEAEEEEGRPSPLADIALVVSERHRIVVTAGGWTSMSSAPSSSSSSLRPSNTEIIRVAPFPCLFSSTRTFVHSAHSAARRSSSSSSSASSSSAAATLPASPPSLPRLKLAFTGADRFLMSTSRRDRIAVAWLVVPAAAGAAAAAADNTAPSPFLSPSVIDDTHQQSRDGYSRNGFQHHHSDGDDGREDAMSRALGLAAFHRSWQRVRDGGGGGGENSLTKGDYSDDLQARRGRGGRAIHEGGRSSYGGQLRGHIPAFGDRAWGGGGGGGWAGAKAAAASGVGDIDHDDGSSWEYGDGEEDDAGGDSSYYYSESGGEEEDDEYDDIRNTGNHWEYTDPKTGQPWRHQSHPYFNKKRRRGGGGGAQQRRPRALRRGYEKRRAELSVPQFQALSKALQKKLSEQTARATLLKTEHQRSNKSCQHLEKYSNLLARHVARDRAGHAITKEQRRQILRHHSKISQLSLRFQMPIASSRDKCSSSRSNAGGAVSGSSRKSTLFHAYEENKRLREECLRLEAMVSRLQKVKRHTRR
eukprot:jgi/Bigna1/67378/fgenesh1_pg.3_\